MSAEEIKFVDRIYFKSQIKIGSFEMPVSPEYDLGLVYTSPFNSLALGASLNNGSGTYNFVGTYLQPLSSSSNYFNIGFDIGGDVGSHKGISFSTSI
ncbi:hypothetical protein, partial [Methylobacterium sp. WL7]|uniref:hypothetical protein n=1 Tax=Methylobacterium sp. WL7 TaxID=2603900 RepID=UPI001AEE7DD0